MRTILVDWMLEVHYKFKLQTPTLWLMINILDRYLHKVPVLRTKIQLVGITTLFVACKFEEISGPEVKDCVFLTDNTYTRQELLQTETSILTALDFQLMVPTGYHFLIRYLNRIRGSERLRLLAFYTSERSFQENDNINVLPHVTAAAALYVALRTARFEAGVDDINVWTPALVEESGLTVSDFFNHAKLMAFRNNEPTPNARRKLEAVKKKFATKTTQYISDVFFPAL
jgi:G2/mitotic-specific cyclin-B, other